jgi:hypothetical protein
VVRKLQLPGDPRSLLDIGGGHGWYSAQLCLRYPQPASSQLTAAAHPLSRDTCLDSARPWRRLLTMQLMLRIIQ